MYCFLFCIVGPYVIACADDRLYLTIDKEANYSAVATGNISKASLFYIVPTDDGGNPNEFLIMLCGDKEKKATLDRSLSSPNSFHLNPVGRYLAAPINSFGKNNGPLLMKDTVDQSKCRFCLHSRLTHHRQYRTAVNIQDWTRSKDVFFINCARRKFKIDGYLCVNQRKAGGSCVTACVSSPKKHNNSDTYMLFRLLPASVRSTGLFDKKEENGEKLSSANVAPLPDSS